MLKCGSIHHTLRKTTWKALETMLLTSHDFNCNIKLVVIDNNDNLEFQIYYLCFISPML
jgi:hypothetical protein